MAQGAPVGTKTTKDEDCGCGDENEVAPGGVTNTPPTQEVLESLDNVELLDANGKTHTFKSIYERDGAERHLLFFARHFFCGVSNLAISNKGFHSC